jgi:homoserine dehydrogenase
MLMLAFTGGLGKYKCKFKGDVYMHERATYAVAGIGGLGQEVIRQISQEHVADRLGLERFPLYLVRHDNPEEGRLGGIYGNVTPENPMGEHLGKDDFGQVSEPDLPDVLFVTTPSSEEGSELSYRNMLPILENGKIVVTAEKVTLANVEKYKALRTASSNFACLGINGTVGGGTRLLDAARNFCHDPENISQIHLALNGTMSAIMGSLAPQSGQGMSLGQAVEFAATLGYAEPGASNPADVIRGEATGDIPKKLAIFMNHLGLCKKTLEDGSRIEQLVDWSDLEFELSDENIASAMEESRGRRLIVSMYSKTHMAKAGFRPEKGRIGGFDLHDLVEDWELVAGFRNVDRNPLFGALAGMTGPGAGIVVGLGPNEQDGVYSCTGPGAGRNPTVNTMIDDYIAKRSVLHGRTH